MKTKPSILAILLLTACTTDNGSSPAEKVVTPVSGSVALVRPIADAHVELFSFHEGQKGELWKDTRSNDKGEWAVDVGYHSGPCMLWVTEGGLEQPLIAIVNDVPQKKGRASIVVSPITHLKFAYIDYLVQSGEKFSDAFNVATKAFREHFARIDHDATASWSPGTAPSGAVTNKIRAFLLNAALDYSARRLTRSQDTLDESIGHLQNLLTALSEDIRADGVFDGRGDDGARLKLEGGGYLSGDTLRSDLAVSLVRLIERGKYKTGLKVSDVQDIADELGQSQLLIFAQPATPLHLAKPRVTIHTPTTKGILTGMQSITCSAEADVELDTLTVQLVRDGKSLMDVVGESNVDISRGTGTANFAFDTTQFNDGALTITCTATDKNENTQAASVVVDINNNAANVSVQGVQAGQVVKDTVKISCDCSGNSRQTSCRLASPRGRSVSGPVKGVYTWDTTNEAEGPFTVECVSQSPGLEDAKASLSVVVDNKKDGIVSGNVFLESPIEGAQIQAFAFRGGRMLREVGHDASPTDGRGEFNIAIDDYYSGPLLLIASGTKATYLSAYDGGKVELGPAKLQVVIDHYTANDDLGSVSINAFTSIAAALTTACVDSSPGEEDSFPGCSHQSHDLLSRHISRDGFEFRYTPVRDFVTQNQTVSRASDESNILGLFHVGLTRLGAEIAAAGGYAIDQLPSSIMMMRLVLDAGNGVFDGLDRQGRPIYMTTSARMTTETMRSDLAHAIARWLNHVAIDHRQGIGGLRNPTTWTSANFSQRSGFLCSLSGDTSALFPSTAVPRPFDTEGPTFQSLAPLTMAGEDVNLSFPQRGVLLVSVRATDPSGVERVWLTVGNLMIEGEERQGGNLYVIELHTSSLPDGAHVVTIHAVDGLGNENDDNSLNIYVKNSRPTVATSNPPAWVKADESVRMHVDVDCPVRRYEVWGSAGTTPRGFDLPADTGSFDVEINIPCDAQVDVGVRVWDWAGNQGESPRAVVKCDSHAPVLTFAKSKFRQERDGLYESYDASGNLSWGQNAAHEKLDLKALAENGDLGILQKYAHRLDYLPNDGLDEDKQNLPTLWFQVEDRGESIIGSDVEDLTVEYRYVFKHVSGTLKERPWSRLTLTSKDGLKLYKVPISYQTLLPEDANPEARRDSNFIERCSKEDEHTIELRATDLAGNVQSKSIRFKLDILWPSVAITNCGMHNNVSNLSIGDGSFAGAHLAAMLPAFQADVFWDMRRPASSLAFNPGLSVAFEEANVQVKVTQVTSEQAITRPYDRDLPAGARFIFHKVVWDGRHTDEPLPEESDYNIPWTRSYDPHKKAVEQSLAFEYTTLSGSAVERTSPFSISAKDSANIHLVMNLTSPVFPLGGISYQQGVDENGKSRLFLHRWPATETYTYEVRGQRIARSRRIENRSYISGVWSEMKDLKFSVKSTHPIPVKIADGCQATDGKPILWTKQIN